MFGSEVKNRRLSRRMSLADLSAATGIDRGLLSKMEGGSRRPTIEQIRSLAESLDLSEEILLAEAGMLPPDVRDALDSVASVITASARQSIETDISLPQSPREDIAHILAESVKRPCRSVKAPLSGDLKGSKGSAAYRAHSYHTKVPPETIIPFIEHFTRPGDVVLDPFCGSGMTGVAALSTGRHAIISDLSPAAVHIARNYTTPCNSKDLLAAIDDLREQMRPTMAWLYEISEPDQDRERTEYVVWSDVYACPHCNAEWAYWDAARGSDGHIVGKYFPCPECGVEVSKQGCTWIGERPVEVNLSIDGQRGRVIRSPNSADLALISESDNKPIPYWQPNLPFGDWREMWRASHSMMGINTAADFYSRRNLHALAALRHAIMLIDNDRIRNALLFAFTAIANRASRRYQWNAKRPTNVMAGTLYVSSLRYEWNVWSLFERKARDIVRYYEQFPKEDSLVDAIRADATDLHHVPDGSVDLVYMDPPFGANIFYADVSLLWEAWLGQETDCNSEIVVNKHIKCGDGGKSVSDYQSLMTNAFSEVRRVLKPNGHAVLVFSNTDDQIWESIRSAIVDSGLKVEATGILDKGQRSIKGVQADLGQQRVTRLDLVLTLSRNKKLKINDAASNELDLSSLICEIFREDPSSSLPTDRLYSRVVEALIRDGCSVAGVSMAVVEEVCLQIGRKTVDGHWSLPYAPEYIDLNSPHGCIANEYTDEPFGVLDNRPNNVKRVATPLTIAAPGSRNTAFYNAHSYMTKVPPEAIEPFIKHYTRPGDIVLDMFAGSGMTGVAAALSGRHAVLRDIAVISSHMAFNHTRPCDPALLHKIFSELYDELKPEFQEIYKVPGNRKEGDGYAHYTLWSERYKCPECKKAFTLYDAIDTSTGRVGTTIPCPTCHSELKRQRLRSMGSVPVLINYQNSKRGGRSERKPTRNDLAHMTSFSRDAVKEWYPRASIGPERDMFNISALHLRGISEVADFYTDRNLYALSRLFSAIRSVEDERVRQVLTFAFTNTAWHGTRMRRFNARGGQRPLTGTLYIPQISSEVNVLEVLRNKVRQLARYYEAFPQSLQVAPPVITLGSAANLTGIPDDSVDYVFTDPPFGSNIFYADCNLITESWLGGITRVEDEAVVNRTLSAEHGGKTLSEYGELLTKALSEAYRVLKPKGWMTMVFHNTDPKVWATIQTAAQSAGFDLVGAGSLDRKQMSHKGYKGRSGKENVAHFDVVMSLRKTNLNKNKRKWETAPIEYIEGKVETLLKTAPKKGREQWIHSELIQALVSDGYDLSSISFSDVTQLISPTSPSANPHDTA